MSDLALALRMLARDWRARELRLLGAALVIAVAAVTAVAFFSDRVHQAMLGQAAEMLAADLAVESPDALPEALAGHARALGLRTAQTIELPSVILHGDQTVLVEVKGVSPEYPLRGALRIADRVFGADRRAPGLPGADAAWVDPKVVTLLGTRPGARIGLGEAKLRVTAVLTREPDRAWSLFHLAPRVLISLDTLTATGLVSPASRVKHRLLVAGERTALAHFRGWLGRHLPEGAHLIDLDEARPELRLTLDRGASFLSLASLCAVVLAGAAIALASRRFAERQADASAILRCLGASRRRVLALFGLGLLGLGLSASLAGCLAGYAAQAVLAALLAGWIDGGLPAPSAAPLLLGTGVGLVTLAGFSLPALLRLGGVSPLRVLRRELGAPPGRAWVAGAGAGAVLCALMIWQAGDAGLALRLLGGLAATLGALLLAALLLVRALGALRHRGGTTLRYALAGLVRSPGTSALQLAGFGLGMTALLLLGVVRADLLSTWERSLPPDAPNEFLINIQPDQVQGVRGFLAAKGLPNAGFYPMIRGRLTHIAGRKVSPEAYTTSRTRALAAREFNLSSATELQPDNRILQGRWWSAAERDRPWLSVEQGIAERLGIHLGDQLEFLVAGEPVRGEVKSLRSVRWDSFNPNFFVIGTPGVLAGQPATWITSVHLPPERGEVAAELVRAFPSVTLLDVSALIAEVRGLMDRGSLAVEYVFLFTLAAGLLVLYAGIQASREARIREAAVLKTLGMSQRRLLAAVAVELGTLGGLAGLLAAGAAGLIGRVLAAQVFDLAYAPAPWLWLLGGAAGALGIGAAGVIAAFPLVLTPPWQVLRRE